MEALAQLAQAAQLDLGDTAEGFDHPRIELLRFKTMTLSKSYGFEPVIHQPGLVDKVRKDWRSLRPLIEWVARRTG